MARRDRSRRYATARGQDFYRSADVRVRDRQAVDTIGAAREGSTRRLTTGAFTADGSAGPVGPAARDLGTSRRRSATAEAYSRHLAPGIEPWRAGSRRTRARGRAFEVHEPEFGPDRAHAVGAARRALGGDRERLLERAREQAVELLKGSLVERQRRARDDHVGGPRPPRVGGGGGGGGGAFGGLPPTS